MKNKFLVYLLLVLVIYTSCKNGNSQYQASDTASQVNDTASQITHIITKRIDVYDSLTTPYEFTVNNTKFRLKATKTNEGKVTLQKFISGWITIAPLDCSIVYFADVNADGFIDIGTALDGDVNSYTAEMYLFNPSKNTFVDCGVFANGLDSSITIINKEKNIYCDLQWGYILDSNVRKFYFWNAYLFKLKNYKRFDIAVCSGDDEFEQADSKGNNNVSISVDESIKNSQFKDKTIQWKGNKIFDYATYWKNNWKDYSAIIDTIGASLSDDDVKPNGKPIDEAVEAIKTYWKSNWGELYSRNNTDKAINTLREFYLLSYGYGDDDGFGDGDVWVDDYGTRMEKVRKKYLSERLLKKIDSLWTPDKDGYIGFDGDPFVQGNDGWLPSSIREKLLIKPLKNKNEYRVYPYGFDKEDGTDNIIYVDISLKKNENGDFLIDDIFDGNFVPKTEQ